MKIRNHGPLARNFVLEFGIFNVNSMYGTYTCMIDRIMANTIACRQLKNKFYES